MITTIDYRQATDLVLQATDRIYDSLPGIHEEPAISLIEAKKKVRKAGRGNSNDLFVRSKRLPGSAFSRG